MSSPGRPTDQYRPTTASRTRVRVWASGVRMRSAVVAVVVVGVALAAGAALLVALLHHSLLGSVRAAASARAVEVARLVRTEPQGFASDVQAGGPSGQVVQVLGPDGAVVASSVPRAAHEPLTRLRPAPDQTATSPVTELPPLDPDERYLVLARGVAQGDAHYVVVVAASTEAQQETVHTVGIYLALGFPVLVLAVGAGTFLLVGRSLRPVEQIRARVAGIGARQLAERVPVPASQDEVARLAVTMNAMLDRLESAHDSQRRFVADASHELRSPLAAFRAGLDVAGTDPDGTSWRDLQPMMDAEVDRMARLVEDLLLLAKVDEDGLRLAATDVDLDDLVDAEVRRLRAATTLRVYAEIAPIRVHGDRAKISQAVRNLTDNAARHAAGRIQLVVGIGGAWAVVQVDDDGPGIGAADRGRVFDRFVRLDDSRGRASGGSGLGLAIVKEIVVRHGGTVEATESPWGGARFTMRLPLDPG